MWFKNFFNSLAAKPTRDRRIRRGPAAGRVLRLESLEGRALLSVNWAGSHAVGTNPSAVVAGDFNNDQHVDLATANYDGTVSVALSDGQGGFGAPQHTVAVPNPYSMAAAHFNNDSFLDLATVVTEGGVPRVLLGNGDGTFRFQQHDTSPIYPERVSMAVADFNADGLIDFAYASSEWGYEYDYRGRVYVYLGDGEGGALNVHWYTIMGGYKPVGLAVADLNGDHTIDVVVANEDGANVSVLLGNGDGTLGDEHVFPGVGAWPQAVAIGDFTGDQIPDLVATGLASGWVSVMPGRGDGTFFPAISSTANVADSLVTADFNGDGKLDVATALWSGENLCLLLGQGNGTFASLEEPWAGYSIIGLATGDLNGDTRPDLIVTGWENTASVLLNDGVWSTVPTTPPTMSINDTTVTEGNTGTVAAIFKVTLSAAASQPISVGYATSNGMATASDFQAVSGTLTFAAGETSKTISVPVKGDRLVESNETFVVNLTNPTYATIADGQGVGTIADNEPRISISDVSKSEGRKGKPTFFTFTVTLSNAYDQPVTMSFGTVNGTATTSDGDYLAKSGTLTFKPGETTKTITIEVKGDSKRESHETFYVDLFGNSSNSLFSRSRGLGTILNDD